jgi:hypothetical protein
MGQTIEVKSVVLGDVAVFDTDRTMTGQDGLGFDSIAAARSDTTTAARLASALFEGEDSIDHVFVLSNQVTVRRSGGWNDEIAAGAAETIRDFFIFYDENRGAPPASTGV